MYQEANGTPGIGERNWIVVGATGFVGRELVYRLLNTSSDHITVLLRAGSDGTSPHTRMARILATLGVNESQWQHRINIINSDLSQPSLGLDDQQVSQLCRWQNMYVHLAANTQFDASMDDALSTNLHGVMHALELAELLHARGALSAFGYVSTAYVHGNKTGLVDVNTPLDPNVLRNNYEHSKCLAEQHVRQWLHKLPIVIFRPSIVVGDSATGRAYGSSTVYWALKRYLRGQSRFFAHGSARLDIVPVDYVVEAMQFLLLDPRSVNQCYPLVAGQYGDITLLHLAQTAGRHFGRPTPKLVEPDRLLKLTKILTRVSVADQMFAKQMLAYLPYFSKNPRFDASSTDAALLGSGIIRPAFDDYAQQLMQHCIESQASRTSTTAQPRPVDVTLGAEVPASTLSNP